ncbi:MAG: hypothetical protein WBQ68_08490 [Terriglobales bacterium]
MPGVCIHEFFWPLRAADGHYYQVCRRCGVQREYDWTSMQRLDGEPETTSTSASSSPQFSPRPQAGPRLTLLIELEPAHRVFLRNLADTLRPAPPGAPKFWSVAFWQEIFLPASVPWGRFAESLLAHVIALIVVVILSQPWTAQDQPLRRSMFENTHLTYYKPDASFPALRGNSPRPRAVYRKPAASARKGSIRVAPERSQEAVKAPELKLKGPQRPNFLASKFVPPVMPLSSASRPSRLPVVAGPTAIVAPPPEVSQATSRQLGLLQASGVAPAPVVSQGTSRRLGLPQASGVAPTPEPGVVSSKRAMTVPGASVVAPAPVVQALVRRLGDVNIGPSAVVAPSPRLPVGEQRTISGPTLATVGSLVAWAVPPPPTALGSGTLAHGRAGMLSGAGSNIVPPPPSVQDAGSSAAGGHRNALSGSSLSGGSLSIAGIQAVPPPPSLQGAGNSGTGERAGALSGTGSGNGVQAVPPPPSVGGLGGEGGAGHGGRPTGTQMAMSSEPAMGPPPSPVVDTPKQQAEAEREPATEEMPLRLIGLAMALPNSNYFSNYEVYIAERRLRKNLTELVKLVYVYLPYQRRLSDYGVDNSKVYKLLVSRDRSCDESLIQMTWPEGDPHPDLQNPGDAPGLSPSDKKDMLPCYRTTADDYRKAMSRR